MSSGVISAHACFKLAFSALTDKKSEKCAENFKTEKISKIRKMLLKNRQSTRNNESIPPKLGVGEKSC